MLLCVAVTDFQVKFEGEDGIDSGGVKKEFFQIMIRRMFDPGFGASLRACLFAVYHRQINL